MVIHVKMQSILHIFESKKVGNTNYVQHLATSIGPKFVLTIEAIHEKGAKPQLLQQVGLSFLRN